MMKRVLAAVLLLSLGLVRQVSAQQSWPLTPQTSTPGQGAAVAQIGPSVALFTVTTNDQALVLTLPGKFRLINPQYLVGTTTVNTTPLQVNYAGGNACTAPTATLSPGVVDDWLYIAGATQPHVCVPTGTLQIEAQQ